MSSKLPKRPGVKKSQSDHTKVKKSFLEPIQWLQVAAIVILCLTVYFNALFNDYLYDDTYQILGNPWIKELKHLPEIFSTNVWAFQARGSNYYRPMMHVIYMVGYHLFGPRAWGFHLINILWHAGVSIVVFLIISRMMKDARPSLSFRFLSPPSRPLCYLQSIPFIRKQ